MIIDFLQNALQELRPDNSSWYTFAKTDSNGEIIPDNDRMQTKFVIVNDDYKGKVTRPTDKEINDKVAELKADYDAKKYQRDREPNYPAIQEQLDLLYHDMTAGKGDKTGEWYKAVNKVKTDNPKPE